MQPAPLSFQWNCLDFCVISVRGNPGMNRGPRMLHADTQQKASPCPSLSFSSILRSRGQRTEKPSFARKPQFEKKKHIYQPVQNVPLLHVLCSPCSASASLKSLMVLAQSQLTTSEDQTCFILNLGRAGEAG